MPQLPPPPIPVRTRFPTHRPPRQSAQQIGESIFSEFQPLLIRIALTRGLVDWENAFEFRDLVFG